MRKDIAHTQEVPKNHKMMTENLIIETMDGTLCTASEIIDKILHTSSRLVTRILQRIVLQSILDDMVKSGKIEAIEMHDMTPNEMIFQRGIAISRDIQNILNNKCTAKGYRNFPTLP